uniref:Uncharacterized protein n=1 Tax=Arion vulgaris TaxID=1028688 RepID=A0A0B6YE41_9EUPU
MIEYCVVSIKAGLNKHINLVTLPQQVLKNKHDSGSYSQKTLPVQPLISNSFNRCIDSVATAVYFIP